MDPLTYIGRAGVVLLATAGTALAAGIGTAFSDDNLALLVVVSVSVTTIVGSVAWIDARIEKKIRLHSKEDRIRHRAILAEVFHLRELLAIKLGLPPPMATPDMSVEEDTNPQ